MTDIDAPPPAQSRPWGYFSTFAWVVIAHLIGTAAGFGAVYALKPDSVAAMSGFDAILKDGWFFVLSTLVAAPVMIAILFWAVRLRRWTLRDYLAFTWPNRREAVIALVALAIFLPALDGAAWLAGQPIVTPFQTDIYVSAQRAGTLVLLWIALVVAAPAWEEIAFRGFIFRSWVRSPQSAIPGILAVSALFAVLHLQYNWFGMLQVFAIGLLLGWSRWRSGSTYMTIAMHAIVNFYSTVQTVVKLNWLT